MKKLAIIFLVFLASCNNAPEAPITESAAVIDSTITVDTLKTDTISEKINILLNDTKNVEKKVSEIKAIKKENKVLKQELVETKAELKEVKQILADTAQEEQKKKKKTFIQTVISNIKKDTVK